jgi:hypothetical protein
MFESKINRGRANGYAPLDGSGKVPLDKLPPIQSTINTGSFAITGSNEFIGNQTISGSLTTTEFIQTSVIQATGSLYLQPDSTDNRHFEIYNTSPTDVHIKSNGGLSFFGDDTNYLKIDDSAGDVTIAAFSDIILTTDDGGVYIGSYGSENGVVTNGYLNTIIGDTDIINGATGNSITDAIGRIPIVNTGSFATTSSLQTLIDATGSFATTSSLQTLIDATGTFVTTSSFNEFTSSTITNSQTSSFTKRTSVPTSLIGSEGDVDGMIAFDSGAIYFANGTYYGTGPFVVSLYESTDNSPNFPITKGNFPKPKIGWTINVSNGFIVATITNVVEYTDYWLVYTNGGNSGVTAPATITLTTNEVLDNIWLKQEFISSSIINSLNSYTASLKATTLISGSSQLTSSYDTRYTLSGSVQPLPSNLVSSSAQITAFGFISSSTTINTGSFATTSSLNTLSSSVDNRFDTLEATIISGSPNYTQVLGNRRTGITTTGVSIISGSITTTGNPVQIMVTGDANPTSTGWCRLQLYRGESAIGNIVQVENESNQNVPYCLNIIDTPSAGTHIYSMRTVSGIAGTFEFGEASGPLLTAVELNTNTNLPSTNNTFTGTNRFNGQVTIGGVGGDEGGELRLVTAETNSTLAGSAVSMDIYQNRLRFFEGGGNNRGVYVDLSKAPAGNAGELMWKASGMVAAGTFVTLDNLKCTVTTSDNRGLSIGAVSTTFEADLSGVYMASGGSAGGSTNNLTYTTTASTSLFNWNFVAHGDTAHYHIRDKTNNRFYRVTMMIGISYLNNFISIERLF